jgi:tetratricopeptide (TPR) repeat protein/DNA-binding CsgD family transcriptional regulator
VGDYSRDGWASGGDTAAETLVSWLNQLPLTVVDTQPRLTYLKARALVSRGSFSQARPLLERALDGIRAQHDGVAELRAATDLAMSSYAEGRYREAVDVLQTVLPAEHAEPAAQAEALLCEAKSRSALDEMRAALAAGERALEAACAVEDFEQRSDLERRVARELAELAFALGDVETAEVMADRAVQIGDNHEHARGVGHEQSLHTLMRVLVARGDFAAAQRVGDEWAALARAEPDSSRRLVDLYRLRGWIALVEQEDEGAEVYFRRAGNRGIDCVALQALQDDWHEARYLAELEANARRTVLPQRAWHIARTWLGLAESQLGSIERGRRLLEEAVAYFTEKELVYWQAGAELQLAWLLKRMGERELSRHYLVQALGFGARTHMMNFAFWHPDVIASACADALADDVHSDYVTELVCHRLKPAQVRYFQPLLYRSVGRQRARLARIVREHAVADTAGRGRTYDARDVSQAVEDLVTQGHLTPEGAVKLATTHQLTRREIEVFTLYIHPNIRGEERQVNAAIAARLVLSRSTVRNYVSSILKKLCASGRDRLELRSWALAQGIVAD